MKFLVEAAGIADGFSALTSSPESGGVRLTVAATRSLPPARGLKIVEIDWLKENGHVTVAATRPLPPGRGLKQNRLIDWREMVVLQLLQLVHSRRLVDWKQKRLIDWSKMVVLHMLRLVPSLRLMDWNKIDWLIEVNCSSYSCCNLSPPAGLWTETEEIDRLK